MRNRKRLLLAPALLLIIAGCGSSTKAGGTSPAAVVTSAATAACAADATKADAGATLPPGFPAVEGFVGIGEKKAGNTTQIKGAIKGGPDDLPTVRDAGLAKLKAAGDTLGDHDQEAGAEADGDFTGQHSGNINVRNLCKGYLVVTYTLDN